MLRLKQQSGVFAPLMGLLIIVLITLVGLVVDLGHIYSVRTELQRAVDAAALAGAHRLVGENAIANANAAAIATAGAHNLGNTALVIDESNVVTGSWNDLTLGVDPDLRFQAGEAPLNAVRVSATATVEHFFFVFLPGFTETDVGVSAIAVNLFEDQTLPFSLISCIQTDDTDTFLKPGVTVCDVEYFVWGSDPDDQAGWTSLTNRPASVPQIESIFSRDGLSEFNQIVYGPNGNGGLENSEVKPGPEEFLPAALDLDSIWACNEQNVGTDIRCGLGAPFDPDIAYGIPGESDPLQIYGYRETLPRWHHTEEFKRIFTLDGTMVLGQRDRLKALRSASKAFNDGQTDPPPYEAYEDVHGHIVPPDFKDGRFEYLIDNQGDPLLAKALQYAGYPMVDVNNGHLNSVLQTFLFGDETAGLPGVLDASREKIKDSLSKENYPLNEEGKDGSFGEGSTLQLTLPVIFLGNCETAKVNKALPYVGLSNLLVTRIWLGRNHYFDVGDPKWVTAEDAPCDFPDFKEGAPPTNGDYQFVGLVGPGGMAIEGMLLPPTRGEDAETGIRRVYLVR